MMSIYAVMMRHAGHTWIDSLWVKENGAKSRLNDQKRIHEALKLDTGVWFIEMTLQDGELATPANPEETSKAEAVLCGEGGK